MQAAPSAKHPRFFQGSQSCLQSFRNWTFETEQVECRDSEAYDVEMVPWDTQANTSDFIYHPTVQNFTMTSAKEPNHYLYFFVVLNVY